MITKDLVPKLRCVNCEARSASLELVNAEITDGCIIAGQLECGVCKKTFSIKNGVPFLIPEEKLSGELWQLWQDHLGGYERRWESDFRKSIQVINIDRKSTHEHFFRFAAITGGDWLDIGCGPGKKRKFAESDAVAYCGLDPLQQAPCEDFVFCQAISEYMPFQDNMFDHVTAIDAIDHFGDLGRVFGEISRILKPNGRFHVLQSIHEINGPITAFKALAHHLKDYVEMRKLKATAANIPKHMRDFTEKTLTETLGKHFSIKDVKIFSPRWYAPNRVFITAGPQ